MASVVDEIPSASLTASVMRELDTLDADPPQDEYVAVREHPPAYNSFEHAYASWHTADEAKQAIAEFDRDPAVAAAERMLKDAQDTLKEMKRRSEEAFKALYPKKSPLASFFSLGKSKQKSSHVDVQLDRDIRESTTTSVPSTTDQLTAEFKRAHEAQAKQDDVVRRLEERVAEFNCKKEALNKVASGGDLAWIQLQRIAKETLISTPEVALGVGEAMEKLQEVENGYDVAKKATTDLTRARLAVQNSHIYFTSALKTCDDVRGTSTGRAVIGALGGAGGINDVNSMIQYKNSVTLASNAQICLNEVFRILDPREHMIPKDRMEDYQELKNRGVMQMSKIYNLMFGGRTVPSGVAGSVKLMLERQEAAFGHLTRLAVWIQDLVPMYTMKEQVVEALRDDARRGVATLLHANVTHDNQA